MKEQWIYIVGEDGYPPPDIKEKMREFHKLNIGKQVNNTITNERPRSLVQNNWFHRVNKLISDFTRNNAKERGDEHYYKINEERTKLWIKEEFLGYVEIDGERQLRKTSKLKTFEMNELWGNLQIYFAPLGLDIPNPNEKE